MELTIGVAHGDAVVELPALERWLTGVPALKGKVGVREQAIGATDLGGVIELVTVAVAGGGTLTVVAQTLQSWISSRNPAIRFTVSAGGRTVEVGAVDVDDALRLLAETLDGLNDQDG